MPPPAEQRSSATRGPVEGPTPCDPWRVRCSEEFGRVPPEYGDRASLSFAVRPRRDRASLSLPVPSTPRGSARVGCGTWMGGHTCPYPTSRRPSRVHACGRTAKLSSGGAPDSLHSPPTGWKRRGAGGPLQRLVRLVTRSVPVRCHCCHGFRPASRAGGCRGRFEALTIGRTCGGPGFKSSRAAPLSRLPGIRCASSAGRWATCRAERHSSPARPA